MNNKPSINKNNKVSIALRTEFDSIAEAALKLGFCRKTLFLWIDGRAITASAKRRIKSEGYGKLLKLLV